jgi:hypothetical protein
MVQLSEDWLSSELAEALDGPLARRILVRLDHHYQAVRP